MLSVQKSCQIKEKRVFMQNTRFSLFEFKYLLNNHRNYAVRKSEQNVAKIQPSIQGVSGSN